MEIESNANPVLSSSLLGPVDTNTKFTGVQFKRFTQSPNGYVAFEDGKLNKTPPSAVKSARADASLIDEVEGFLQRANSASSFDIEVIVNGKKTPQDVWCRLSDIMMRNYNYYERYIKSNGKIGLPNASDTVITTAFTEQTQHVKMGGKEHTIKASEIFTVLLNFYEQLNERLIIFKTTKDAQYLEQNSNAYCHELLYLKYKISGWLNLWKTMIECDHKIEERIKTITESVSEWIEDLRESKDEEILAAHDYYMRHLSYLRSEKEVNSVMDALNQAYLSENEESVTDGKNETNEKSSSYTVYNHNNVTGTPIVMLKDIQTKQPKFKQLEASPTIESSSLCPVAKKNNEQAKKLDEQKIGQKRKYSDAIACSPETGSRAQRLAMRDTLHNMYKDPKPTACHSVEDEYFVKSGEERIAQQSQTLVQAEKIFARIKEIKGKRNNTYIACQNWDVAQEILAKRTDGPILWYASPDFRKNNQHFTSSNGCVPAPETCPQKGMKI